MIDPAFEERMAAMDAKIDDLEFRVKELIAKWFLLLQDAKRYTKGK
jgi:hypothetical protein